VQVGLDLHSARFFSLDFCGPSCLHLRPLGSLLIFYCKGREGFAKERKGKLYQHLFGRLTWSVVLCYLFLTADVARVAQWIRAFASGAKGRRFDPCRGYQYFKRYGRQYSPFLLRTPVVFGLLPAMIGGEAYPLTNQLHIS
jgi:hypothetical protein